MNIRRAETFVIIAIIGVIGVAYALSQKPMPVSAPQAGQSAQTQQETPTQGQAEQVPNTHVKYDGVEGKTALELLKAGHQVKTQEYSGLGEFVTGIDGVEADGKNNFWSFYVNGKQSPIGASQYVTRNGDVIEWKVEQIEAM